MVGPTRNFEVMGRFNQSNNEYGDSIFDIRWPSAMYIQSYDLL
jgi:hypothetical protein